MPNYTENVGLRLITRPDEDNENFNTQSMLNDNWDKIDDAIGDLPSALTDMGLDEHGSVVDAVNKLADFGNWYVWQRWPYVAADNTAITKPPYTNSADSFMTYSVFTVAGSSYQSRYAIFEYGTSAKIRSDGTFYIENPQEITIYGNGSSTNNTMVAAFNSLVGNYIRMKSFDGTNLTLWSIIGMDANKIWRIPADCEFTYLGSKSYNGGYAYMVGNTVGIRELTARSAEHNSKSGSMDYAANPEKDKYPTNGKQGDYWYSFVGSAINLGVQIYEYVGTGTYGENYPTEWGFTHTPSAFIVSSYFYLSKPTETHTDVTFWTRSDTRSLRIWSDTSGKVYVAWTVSTSSGAPTNQFNTLGQKYTVIGIG